MVRFTNFDYSEICTFIVKVKVRYPYGLLINFTNTYKPLLDLTISKKTDALISEIYPKVFSILCTS